MYRESTFRAWQYHTKCGDLAASPALAAGPPSAALSSLPKRHDHRPCLHSPAGGLCRGRRFRQAHDENNITNTFGCAAESVILAGRPSLSCRIGCRLHHRSVLWCRQQACEHIATGDSVEQAGPHCQNLSRSPDPSTLRRWAHRRLLSISCWVKVRAIGTLLLWTPTILAWDPVETDYVGKRTTLVGFAHARGLGVSFGNRIAAIKSAEVRANGDPPAP